MTYALQGRKGFSSSKCTGDLWEPSIVELDGNQTMQELTGSEEVNGLDSQFGRKHLEGKHGAR